MIGPINSLELSANTSCIIIRYAIFRIPPVVPIDTYIAVFKTHYFSSPTGLQVGNCCVYVLVTVNVARLNVELQKSCQTVAKAFNFCVLQNYVTRCSRER